MAEQQNAAWEPDWTLPPAPAGDDEQAVKDFYYQSFLEQGTCASKSWRELDEWMREAWRREYRDA